MRVCIYVYDKFDFFFNFIKSRRIQKKDKIVWEQQTTPEIANWQLKQHFAYNFRAWSLIHNFMHPILKVVYSIWWFCCCCCFNMLHHLILIPVPEKNASRYNSKRHTHMIHYYHAKINNAPLSLIVFLRWDHISKSKGQEEVAVVSMPGRARRLHMQASHKS